MALLVASCATAVQTPTPTAVPTEAVAPAVPNLVGEGVLRGVHWIVTMERARNGDLCFVSRWVPDPSGTTCGPDPAERGFVWNIGADATSDKPTLVYGYASPEVATVRVEMREATGFAVPVMVEMLEEDTRAFALAFPPLFHLRTVFALDENGDVIQTLPIFPE